MVRTTYTPETAMSTPWRWLPWHNQTVVVDVLAGIELDQVFRQIEATRTRVQTHFDASSSASTSVNNAISSGPAAPGEETLRQRRLVVGHYRFVGHSTTRPFESLRRRA